METNQILVLRDNAKHELLQIKSVEDGITYLNKLKAIDIWVRAEKKDAELQNIIAEQKLRTQRILGELIADGQRKGTIATEKNNQYAPRDTREAPKNIKDIGLTYDKSSAFQQIASIPEEAFEEFIQTGKQKVNDAVAELTTTGAVKLAKSLNHNKNKKHEHSYNPDFECEVRDLLERINALPIFYRIKIKRGIKRGS